MPGWAFTLTVRGHDAAGRQAGRCPGLEEASLSGRMKFAIAGAVIGIILMIALPSWALWVGAAVIVAALALPAIGYLMLDPSQRRRLREIQRRKQIGR
jgi:hypothetical protein